MGLLRRNEAGESSLSVMSVVLLIVLLLILVGLIFVAYKHFHNNSAAIVNNNVKTIKSSNSFEPDATATSTATESPTGTTVISLTSLGIEFTIPNTLKDLIYQSGSTSTTSGAASGKGIAISTQKLTDLSANCGVEPSANNGSTVPGLGDLIEYTGKYTASSNPDKKAYFSKIFPEFVVDYDVPTSQCSTTASTQAVAATQLAAFEKALTTIQLLP